MRCSRSTKGRSAPGKFNALRAEIEAIPEDAFANHEHLGIGDKIRDIICFAVAPEE